MIRKIIAIAILGFTLISCRTEETTVIMDTSGWPRECLGYHSIATPPELSLTHSAAEVGTQEISVVSTEIPVKAFIESQEDFGEALVVKEVNGWMVVVASENLGLTVSSRTVVVYAAQRVGARIVLTRAGASKSLIADGGNDPRLWAFHAQTTPLPMPERGASKGFCFDSIFFASQAPAETASFFATFAELELPDNQGVRRPSNDNMLELQIMIDAQDTPLERPLAPQTDISSLPGVKTKSEEIRVGGREFSLVTTVYDDGKQKGHWHDAATFGKAGSTSEPSVITFKYNNSRLDPAKSREMLIAIMAGLSAK